MTFLRRWYLSSCIFHAFIVILTSYRTERSASYLGTHAMWGGGGGRLIFNRDYEELYQGKAAASDNFQHSKPFLETLLRIENLEFPPVPYRILYNTLPQNLVVPEPLIRKCYNLCGRSTVAETI